MADNKNAKNPNLKDVFKKYSEEREGKFQEATGGGTPIPKGEKLKDHPEAKRVMQPRDDDGQFTYNAVNNKPLKYGPSRGTTIPPLLAGMKINFVNKKKDAVILDGLVYLSGLDFTKDDLMKMLEDYSFEDYVDENGENKSRVVWNNLPDAEMTRKRGRRSQAEKDMIASGQDGFVNPDATIMSDRNLRPDGPLWKKFKKKTNPIFNDLGTGKKQPNQNVFSPELAKSNPVEFGKKYQKEINAIIKKNPNVTVSKIINAFASGKVKDFDHLNRILNSKK
jgi:hypothetical protein